MFAKFPLSPLVPALMENPPNPPSPPSPPQPRDVSKLLLFLYWFGMSVAYHSFPSLKDVTNARYELTTWYSSAFVFKLGFLKGVFAWFTVPLFVVLYLFTIPMAFFSQVSSLGLIWFVVLFFVSAIYLV